MGRAFFLFFLRALFIACSVPFFLFGSDTEPFMDGTTPSESRTLRVKGIDYVFRWCPAGEFTMGSPKSEEGRFDNEVQHKVTLTRGFWILECEVTQGMWRSVMGTTVQDQREKADKKEESLLGVGSDYPMYYVSWEESAEFCRRLSGLCGEEIVLPTEAQWEYACRAGTTASLYTGEIEILGKNNAPALDAVSWYAGNSSVDYSGGEVDEGCNSRNWLERQYSGSPSGTHRVKLKKANAWGLYDMIGNVFEWCSDWSGGYPDGPASDPVGPSGGSCRVVRGGSWYSFASDCRSGSGSGIIRRAGSTTWAFVRSWFRRLSESGPSSCRSVLSVS